MCSKIGDTITYDGSEIGTHSCAYFEKCAPEFRLCTLFKNTQFDPDHTLYEKTSRSVSFLPQLHGEWEQADLVVYTTGIRTKVVYPTIKDEARYTCKKWISHFCHVLHHFRMLKKCAIKSLKLNLCVWKYITSYQPGNRSPCRSCTMSLSLPAMYG